MSKDTAKPAPAETNAKAKEAEPSGTVTAAVLHAEISAVHAASTSRESKGLAPSVRTLLTQLRGPGSASAVRAYLEHHGVLDEFAGWLAPFPAAMDTGAAAQDMGEVWTSWTIEMNVFVHLLVVVLLLDAKHVDEAMASAEALRSKAQEHVGSISSFHAQNLKVLMPKVLFYFALAHERGNRLDEIRAVILRANRVANNQRDDETAATTLNIMLRYYIRLDLFDQAENLLSKAVVHADNVSGFQLARLRYYEGVVRATQLDYSGAYEALLEAQRKAPEVAARGFRVAVAKLLVIVSLLMGELPERAVFRQRGMVSVLVPYLRLTQAVRVGDLKAFQAAIADHKAVFVADGTDTLVARLRHSVIKTGLRKISIAYSRISLEDVCAKLHLHDAEEAEYVVAKAIRDGVILADIDHDLQVVKTHTVRDVYATAAPQEACHARIQYCLKMHDDIVRALRFAPQQLRDAAGAATAEASS